MTIRVLASVLEKTASANRLPEMLIYSVSCYPIEPVAKLLFVTPKSLELLNNFEKDL